MRFVSASPIALVHSPFTTYFRAADATAEPFVRPEISLPPFEAPHKKWPTPLLRVLCELWQRRPGLQLDLPLNK